MSVKNIWPAGMEAAISSGEFFARKMRFTTIITVLLALRMISGQASRQISKYPPGSRNWRRLNIAAKLFHKRADMEDQSPRRAMILSTASSSGVGSASGVPRICAGSVFE